MSLCFVLIACLFALLARAIDLGSAQPALPTAYYLGVEDRNRDGVSDLRDGTNLYAVVGTASTRLNTDDENVRSDLPDWQSGSVAYVADVPKQEPSLTLVTADGQRQSIRLTGLKAPIVQRCGETVWISAQDLSNRSLLIGYDRSLTEIARVTVPFTSPEFTFDPTGQWAAAYTPSARKLQLYRLPDLSPVSLPDSIVSWGPPVWAHRTARLALPVQDAADANKLRMALIVPPDDIQASDDLGLPAGQIKQVQAMWSADERYLSYRTLPGASLNEPLPLRLFDTATHAITTYGESDTQIRPVTWSSDDHFALVSEASSLLADQISVSYRFYNPSAQQLLPGNQVSTLLAPVAFAWQPKTHSLAVLGKSQINGKSGIYAFDVETAEITTLYRAGDADDILHGSLFWTSDGESLLFTARSTDPLSELTGNSNTLHRLDIRTGKAAILSPDDVTVLPYGIQVR